jgi:hypothetical protein
MPHAGRSPGIGALDWRLSLREGGSGSPHGIYFKAISRGQIVPMPLKWRICCCVF